MEQIKNEMIKSGLRVLIAIILFQLILAIVISSLEIHLKGISKDLLLFGILWLIQAPITILLYVYSFYKDYRIVANGMQSIGVVLKFTIANDGVSDNCHYQYETEDMGILEGIGLCNKEYVKIDQKYVVIYDKRNPKKSLIFFDKPI